MTVQPQSYGISQPSSLTGVPAPYAENPLPESQAHWWIRRMDWERLERCVKHIPEKENFSSGWSSGFFGAAITSLVGFVTIPIASHITTRAAVIMVLLGLIALFSTLGFFFTRYIEKKERSHRTSHLDALKEEMKAIKHYVSTQPEKPIEGV